MTSITINIEGMACSMCEAHISEAIRKTFPDAKKVRASHRKGTVSFMTDQPIDEEQLKQAIEPTGYGYQGFREEAATSRHWFKH